MIDRERRDQQLFNQIAAAYARKDVTASSVIARQYRVECAVSPILQTRQDLGVVVDLGCGVGAPAKYLHGRYQQYIGIDQSAELIAVAEQFTQELTQVQFKAANAKATHLPDHCADVILSIGALHHMTELEAVIQELTRIARPGAYLAVIEPQNGNPLIQGMRWLRARLDGSYSEEQIYFAAPDLVSLFRQQGLTDLQVRYVGYASTPFAQVILNPQTLTVPLSRSAVHIDRWLTAHLPAGLRRLSFDVAVHGRFRHQ